MRRTRFFVMLMLLTALIALISVFPASADGSLAVSVNPSTFSAGQNVYIYVDAPKSGKITVTVFDGNGQECAVIFKNKSIASGFNELTWDGTADGKALAGGAYTLRLTMGDLFIDMPVTLISDADEEIETLLPTEAPQEEAEEAQDEQTEVIETVSEENALYPAPNERSSVTPDHDAAGCYFCTPMDITDEEAVWAMLTSPISVVSGGQKEQVIIRAEPDDSSEGIGVVTCVSQGLHVLENRDDGWSLVECYSSSFHDSKVKAWNAYVTGYIRTNKIKKVKVSQEYGIVIDKLTQTLYLFKDGHLYTTLAVSTGLYNSKQPYNETRSGEFMLVSKVGDFRSDAMVCGMAIRFNSGDLLHEVPHVTNADGSKNYKSTEYKLASRASHGCIRVQRLKNADGINMTWLWKNLPVGESGGAKLVIWEDYQGRQIEIPDASTKLYYNPNGGSSYHSVANCNGVRDKYLPLTEFTYGELEDSTFKDLTVCAYCQPPKRVAEIEEINKTHQTSSPGMVNEYHNVSN